MDEAQFQSWMKKLAAMDEGAHTPSANMLWRRAQLRQRLDVARRATRPIRIAEAAGGVACWIVAAVASAGMGTEGLAAFLIISAAIFGGVGAAALRKS